MDEAGFLETWRAAPDQQKLKEVLLRHERFCSLELASSGPTSLLVDRAIRDLDLPEGCLVAVIHRAGHPIVPRGSTVLRNGTAHCSSVERSATTSPLSPSASLGARSPLSAP